MTHPRNIIIATVAAAFIAAPAAFAGSVSDTQSVGISIAGYDLTTEAGAKLVLNKIESAAEQVCDVRPSERSIQARQFAASCVATAVSNAVATVDTPVLTRLHAAYVS